MNCIAIMPDHANVHKYYEALKEDDAEWSHEIFAKLEGSTLKE